MLINIERTAFLEVNSLQKYKKLFFSTFELSACTFGGGFVIIPLMRKKFVEELGWIEEDEMMDESMWNLCLLITMLIVSRKNPKAGTLTCMYFVIYGLGRFLIEGLRTDSLYIIPGIRVSQVLSLFLICGGILLYIFFVRRNKTKNVYSGRYIR